jgi:hypothetical protein
MPTEDGTRHLGIYLEDHLAGSTGAIELIRRAAGKHAGTELGSFLDRLGAEVAEDRDTLRRVITALGTSANLPKQALAWLVEKAARLKLNAHLLRRSPLSPLVELEMMTIGVNGKLLLWHMLSSLYGEEAPGGVRLGELIARAERQLEELKEHRLAAGRRAFEG